ncbi:MAG TPA: carboxypeptidase-like regulatory domain-containing protein [Flavobacterium sp.]|jgi:hypothetical protein
MKKYLLFLFFFVEAATAQIAGTITDSVSGKAVSYVNVWIEGENIGVSGSEAGIFKINNEVKDRIVVFSAVGYETKKLAASAAMNVQLNPITYQLEEVTIQQKAKAEPLVIGNYKKGKIDAFFACFGQPWIVAKYFPYTQEMLQTPFLKEIVLVTQSDVDNAKFNIRFMEANEDGSPGADVAGENLIAIAEKGKKYLTVNLENHRIQFPETGLFIAIEWLIIRENAYEISVKQMAGELKQTVIYSPKFGFVPSAESSSWRYAKGNWDKLGKSMSAMTKFEGKFQEIAMKITLSN